MRKKIKYTDSERLVGYWVGVTLTLSDNIKEKLPFSSYEGLKEYVNKFKVEKLITFLTAKLFIEKL